MGARSRGPPGPPEDDELPGDDDPAGPADAVVGDPYVVVEVVGHAQVVAPLDFEGELGEVLRADDVHVKRLRSAVLSRGGEAEGDGGLVEAEAGLGFGGGGSGQDGRGSRRVPSWVG